MSDNTYQPPKVWEWKKNNGGAFANINRPISGATHEKDLPVGSHPLQLYSLGTPNGQKVTIMLEELLALGVTVIAALAWGIFGVIYERVSGNGIVMLQSQFDTIQAPAGGVLISFDLETGDFVRRGQMVGRLFSFSDLENLRESYQKLKEFTAEHKFHD